MIMRWIFWTVGVVAVLCSLYAALLFFPQVLIHRSVCAGPVTIYYDRAPRADVQQLAREVARRVSATRYIDTTRAYRVFYFQNQKLYNVFARMSGVTALAQGFALSVTGNAFVSAPRVVALGRRSGRQPKFSIWEGSPAHTIAHELGHLGVTRRIGRAAWSRLPEWKQEGLPEYIANIGSIREDTGAALAQRIAVLGQDWKWRNEYGHDRTLYEAGLMVEFLIDVKGYSLEEILDEKVTRQGVRSAMMPWASGAEHADSLNPTHHLH